MKKITLLLLFVVTGIFAQDLKFTAKIANPVADVITIAGPAKFRKEIKADDKGTFTGSFPVTAGIYQLVHGNGYTLLYLKPGYDLALTFDFNKFDETVAYTGKGEKENNFLAAKILMEIDFQNNFPNLKSKTDLDAAIAAYNKKMTEKLSDKALDPDFRTEVTAMIKEEIDQIVASAQAAETVEKMKGTASASFDYENYKGGKTKLEDFKGKYVYIDVWATWCGPCRGEIPFLKKTEEAYEGKNIEFVSISIDELKDNQKWKTFVKDKELGGTQLFADKDWSSDFIRAYGIEGIPRFILIGPDGKIVNADAPRPSSPQLKVDLDAL